MTRVVRVVLALGILALLWHVQRTGELSGVFLGMPYDLRPPTLERLRQRLWNRDEERLVGPTVFGWGYAPNLYQIGRRLGWPVA